MFNNPLIFHLLTASLGYLDPGSGSFILQLVIASLLGGAFIVKSYWKKIKSFFSNRSSNKGDDQPE
jgi:hypothetical protein